MSAAARPNILDYIIDSTDTVVYGNCVHNELLENDSPVRTYEAVCSYSYQEILNDFCFEELQLNVTKKKTNFMGIKITIELPEEWVIHISFVPTYYIDIYLYKFQHFDIDLLVYTKYGYHIHNEDNPVLAQIDQPLTFDLLKQKLVEKKLDYLPDNYQPVYRTWNLGRFKRFLHYLKKGFNIDTNSSDIWTTILWDIKVHSLYTTEEILMQDMHYAETHSRIVSKAFRTVIREPSNHHILNQIFLRYILEYQPFESFLYHIQTHPTFKLCKIMLNNLIDEHEDFLLDQLDKIKQQFQLSWQYTRNVCHYKNKLVDFLFAHDILKPITLLLDYALDYARHYTDFRYDKLHYLLKFYDESSIRGWANYKLTHFHTYLDHGNLDEYAELIKYTNKRIHGRIELKALFHCTDTPISSAVAHLLFKKYRSFFGRNSSYRRSILRRMNYDIEYDFLFWKYVFEIPTPEIIRLVGAKMYMPSGLEIVLTPGKLITLLPADAAAVIAMHYGKYGVPLGVALSGH